MNEFKVIKNDDKEYIQERKLYTNVSIRITVDKRTNSVTFRNDSGSVTVSSHDTFKAVEMLVDEDIIK